MILVIAEQRAGKLNRASWEAIAAAQRESRVKTIRLDASRRLADRDFSGAAALLREALTDDPREACSAVVEAYEAQQRVLAPREQASRAAQKA